MPDLVRTAVTRRIAVLTIDNPPVNALNHSVRAILAAVAAVDRGVALPNITDGFSGQAPDLGALEIGQPVPIYGPRPQ